ncbi:ATP-binding SpoIIE family protein phosphatase [Streptomyces sp. 150FB]|uniref:ATP-binding SpoIIE family protein phosphatase n=1 Tax=Streptomyces sp. 150FB TaxID=1576605 RepID=UPI00123726A2|nr:ATP-binding SpoIIE family protein phosphatase [Streptomyces sp. 150FB]
MGGVPGQALRDLELLSSAISIGSSLDVGVTARHLADLVVPRLGDLSIVSLAREISDGEEPPERTGGGELHLRRIALAPADHEWPEGFLVVGDDTPPQPDKALIRKFQAGESFALTGRSRITAVENDDPALVRAVVPVAGDDEELSVMIVPLVTERGRDAHAAPGLLLGVVEVWRKEPFTDADVQVVEWLSTYAAVSIDNARRYTREHRTALTLQESLLPRARATVAAGETAGVYVPAGAGGGGLSGDWFDVIPLSSARVALVVGDVVGRGVRAVATMGRMRTAVRTLADLDFPPDELLTHLDDLVIQLAEGDEPGRGDVSGCTCVYAVVDPIARRGAVASAGHPPPALVRTDGTTEYIPLVPGPLLGVGGLTFEVAEFDLRDGDVLALYTNGLIEHQWSDMGLGMDTLRERLTAVCPTSGDLHAAASSLVEGIPANSLVDDIALLLARVRGVPDEDTVSWKIPADPAMVADSRERAADRVSAWGLDDLAYTTEMVVSELVTNAIRYGGGDATLRLIRGRDRLICEVSDPSNTAPHLKRAREADEGGRGLFITARLVTRWGVRYTPAGKTIWTEQRLQRDGRDGRDAG